MTSNAGPITETPCASATGDAMQMGSGPMGGLIGGGMGTTDQMGLESSRMLTADDVQSRFRPFLSQSRDVREYVHTSRNDLYWKC